jgi:hypothetical protein
LLILKELGDKQAKWMTTLQEYNLEIKPTKIVRGQGLCKLAANLEGAQVSSQEGWENELEVSNEVQYVLAPTFSWYNDIKYYLNHCIAPQYLEPNKKKALRLKSIKYHLIDGVLFKKNYDNVFLRCLEKPDVDKVLVQLHDGPVGGNFGEEMIVHKILIVGYFWSTLFKDAYVYARK